MVPLAAVRRAAAPAPRAGVVRSGSAIAPMHPTRMIGSAAPRPGADALSSHRCLGASRRRPGAAVPRLAFASGAGAADANPSEPGGTPSHSFPSLSFTRGGSHLTRATRRDDAFSLIEGPRGEVMTSSDENLDEDYAGSGVASQTGSGGYGSRRTSRRKKGRVANRAAAVAQGTRGAASRSYDTYSYDDSYDETQAVWDSGGSFAASDSRRGRASGSSGARGGSHSGRHHRRAGSDLGDLMRSLGSDRRELQGFLKALQRSADKGDADGALAALRALQKLSNSGPDATSSGAAPLAAYNAALRACKRSRPPAHVEARRLLLEMRSHERGPGPDAQTYHEVIAALARAHEWRLAERTFAEFRREFPSHAPSVLVYTSLISAYGKGGQWDKAKDAFEALRSDGTKVDTGVYNALLSAAVSASEYREAAKVFDRMPSEGVRRNATTYNAALTSFGRQRRLRDMEMLRREMRRCGIEANETTFSVLITAHGNAGDAKRACALLDEACDAPWVYKSAVVFNSALGACVKAGDERLAKRVLERMREEGIYPTLVTHNTLLMAASAERDWEHVADVFRDVLRGGQSPDAITLDCMCGIEKLQAAADARAEAEEAARRVVGERTGDEPEENRDEPNDDAAGSEGNDRRDLGGTFQGRDLGRLCELLRIVLDEEIARAERSVTVDEETLTFGASSASARRGSGEVLEKGAGVAHAYDALLRALHASGRGEEVEATYREMLRRGTRRTVHTYNTLIASYEARRQWQRAGDAMTRMQEEGIAPDAITFDALIDVTEETGQWDRATAWLEQAQERGFLRCEDELGVLDLHRIRSAGTAQTVLRWWLRRMRGRALAPLDAAAAGRGTRAILETAGAKVGGRGEKGVQKTNGNASSIPVQIRDLPPQIQVVTGWGKHSTVFGHSPVKERVVALLGGLNSPFDVPDHNIGCVVADRGEVRAWLVRDELLSLVRFLGGNRDALKRNFNPKSAGLATRMNKDSE